MQRPQLARPSHIRPADQQFNETLYGDLFEMPDAAGVSFWFLLLVDDATDYATLSLVPVSYTHLRAHETSAHL
eukprot:4048497-Alexandrium_andersonii.AAC.1